MSKNKLTTNQLWQDLENVGDKAHDLFRKMLVKDCKENNVEITFMFEEDIMAKHLLNEDLCKLANIIQNIYNCISLLEEMD